MENKDSGYKITMLREQFRLGGVGESNKIKNVVSVFDKELKRFRNLLDIPLFVSTTFFAKFNK